MRRNGFILFIISFLFIPASWADTAPLTLAQALELAGHFNPRMIQARQSITAAQGERMTAAGLADVEIELEFGDANSFEIRQPLDPLGVYSLKGKIAANGVNIQSQALRSAWSAVYLEVRELYFQAILHKKEFELARSNLNAMRQFFSQVQLKYESGQAFKNDFQRAKIELLKAENEDLAAQKGLKTNKARLNMALDRPMETEFDVEENLQEEQLAVSFEELKELMHANRPDIKIARLELDSKQKNLTKEKLSRLPSYYVGFKREDREERDDSMFLLGVRLPLWGFNQGAVKKAQAEQEIQRSKVGITEDKALLEVYEAYLNAELHHKQLRLHKTSLEESNELFRLANLRYKEGKIGFMDYLDQVRTSVRSKVDYYHALFNLSTSISVLETLVHSSLRQGDLFNEKI